MAEKQDGFMAQRYGTDPEALAARLRQSDESALEAVLREYGPAVHAVLLRKYAAVLREADIDDVLSVALFRVWQSRRQFDEAKGSLRVWFFGIAENVARDVLRLGWHKARRLEVAGDRLDYPAAVDDPQNGKPPELESAGAAVKQALREIIDALPAAQQRIIQADALCRDGVAASRWLAGELEISEASVRVYRKRAIDTIRARLAERGLAPQQAESPSR